MPPLSAPRQPADSRPYVARRQPDRAVPLLIDAEAWDELGGVFMILLGAAHATVPRDVLADWYGRLPSGAQSGPYGRLLAAALVVETDPSIAWVQLERCAETFRAAGSAEGEAACLAELARLAWWSHEPERLAALAVGCRDSRRTDASRPPPSPAWAER